MENNKKTDLKAQGATAEKAKTETPVREIGKNLPVVQKKAVDLASTIKTVEDLYKLVRQRDRLEVYGDTLKDFSIEKKDEEFGNFNRFGGCALKITDDANKTFEIKHPFVISEVVAYMVERIDTRRAALEEQIKLPKIAA